MRNSASRLTHAGAARAPSLGCGPCERRGALSAARAPGLPAAPGRVSAALAVRAQHGSIRLLSFVLFLENGNNRFLSFLEEKPEETIGAEETTSGGARETAGHAPQGCTQSPASGNFQGNPAACPCKQWTQWAVSPLPAPLPRPTPASPDPARPHEPGSWDRLYNHSFRTQLASKAPRPKRVLKPKVHTH